MAEEIPDWVENTPDECRRSLIMFDSNGDNVQEIDISHDEYIALKAHLAAMRGHTVGDFRARITDLVTKSQPLQLESDLQQFASHLEIARDLYRSCPDLVVFDSDELTGYIEKLEAWENK